MPANCEIDKCHGNYLFIAFHISSFFFIAVWVKISCWPVSKALKYFVFCDQSPKIRMFSLRYLFTVFPPDPNRQHHNDQTQNWKMGE